jgi:hypothetical protein
MKYLKTFEKKMNNAKIGDYVICHIIETDPEEKKYTDEFLNNNIGILKHIDTGISQGWYVKFDKIPYDRSFNNELCKSFDFKTKIAAFYDDEIIYWGKSEEEVKMLRNMKKYNL